MLSKTLNEVPSVSSSFSLLFTHTYQASGTMHEVKSKIFILKRAGWPFRVHPNINVQSLISLEWDSVFKGSEELPGDSAVLSCWVKEKKRWESSSRRSWHCAHPAREGTRHLFAHVLYFQRQPGFSSLLEAVAWPRAARRRGPPAGWNVWGWAVHRENACHGAQSRNHPQPFVLLAQFTSPFEMA